MLKLNIVELLDIKYALKYYMEKIVKNTEREIEYKKTLENINNAIEDKLRPSP